MDFWDPKRSHWVEEAIRRWEAHQWLQVSDDAHLEWAAGMCRTHRKPPQEWVENAEIAAALLAWRRQGPDGPFR